MLDSEIKNYIKSYPDFPKKGINFRDILPLLLEPKIFSNLINEMSNQEFLNRCEAIIAIDARGFIFGTAIATKLQKPLILARKPGKLPGKLTSFTYELEYGNNSLSIQKDLIAKFNSFAIVDDLLATGGTVNCVRKIIEINNKKILGLSVVIELKDLKGSSNLNFPVFSQVAY